MQIDKDQKLIATPSRRSQQTTLQPDLVLDSNSCHLAYINKMTVPWEYVIEESFECQKLLWANLAAEAEDRGWKVCLVEVGCRGFIAITTTKLLREAGVREQAHWQGS